MRPGAVMPPWHPHDDALTKLKQFTFASSVCCECEVRGLRCLRRDELWKCAVTRCDV